MYSPLLLWYKCVIPANELKNAATLLHTQESDDTMEYVLQISHGMSLCQGIAWIMVATGLKLP